MDDVNTYSIDGMKNAQLHIFQLGLDLDKMDKTKKIFLPFLLKV